MSLPPRTPPDLVDKLGLCQWFHFQAYEDVERTVDELRALGVRHLRTGVSWADYHRRGGQAWYDWQFRALQEFEVLLSVWHTPPSLAEGGRCAGPPHRLQDYADFIWLIVDRYGDRFADLELWNEPNNRLKWDFERFDPRWEKFGTMIAMAGNTARAMGKRTVLGGMIPVDPHWLALMKGYGALDAVDVVAIHGFPGMWWSDAPNWDWYQHWHGWPAKIHSVLDGAGGRPIWVTETGLATWNRERSTSGLHDQQVMRLEQAVLAPAERVYWYSVMDLDPRREAIEGFHVDENEYHLGLTTYAGARKPAWARLRELLVESPIAGNEATTRRERLRVG